MEIRDVLKKFRTVAVVGCSRDPAKDAHSVPAYLQAKGYRIVPVNPSATEILGERAYPDMLAIPPALARQIDIVEIFRPSADVPPIVEQALELRKKYGRPFVVWMQLGIVNEQAAAKARAAGVHVIMDRCMRIECKRLYGEG